MSAWRTPAWIRIVCGRTSQDRIRVQAPSRVEGIVEYLRVRGDANEPQDTDPRKTHAAGPVHQRLPPLPRRPVPLEF